jgi:plastocyanin
MRTIVMRIGASLLLLGSTIGLGASVATAGKGLVRPPSPGLSAIPTTRVKIVNFAFKPRVLSIAKGTRVKWVNRDGVSHTTTSNKGIWDSGALRTGETFRRVFKKAGTFKYHCSIHPTMTGKIVVG